MKIILEGTAEELRNILLFGIPQNIVSDDGSQFLCGDIAGRGYRRKATELGFMPDSDSSEIKALTKEHANRRRQVRQQLNSLSEQTIPEAVANYFKGNKLSVPFEKR